MSTQTVQELNAAQACIYTRTNLQRAFKDFDDTEITGIYLRNDSCLVVRRDGSEQTYNRTLIQHAFMDHAHRLKDFFAYLGPNYRGPSIWRNNAYIMFKGWHYSHALGHLSSNAKLQTVWADKFIHLTEQEKLKAILQSNQTDLGYIVAPDGYQDKSNVVDLESEFEQEESNKSNAVIQGTPTCSCGSYQRQLQNLREFSSEITGFQPWCIHLTWFHKYREFLCKRTDARNTAPSGAPNTCVAWWYAPPADSTSDGRFVLLHTKSGAQAPLSHWRTYKPKQTFNQKDAWDLFFNMLEAGYVPFPGVALPQLQLAVKKQ
jgi:hypothetical protein